MPQNCSSGLRTAIAQAYLDRIGANGIVKTYNGAAPAGVAAITGGNTLLATHTATGVFGVASAAGIDVTEANFANVAASNVTGTPTFVDLCTSAGVVEARVKVPGDGWSYSGAIVGGQAVTMTALTIPVGNA